ncbi:MAG: glutathione peroxidase [bacterium]
MSVHKFKALDINNKQIDLSIYRGKVLLVVNTASKCALTPQFEQLEKLYNLYKDKNFEILGFPCDQFKEQEFASNNEIKEFCQINYGVSFKMFSKIDVNGANSNPIYEYLKNQKKGTMNNDIKWNFTKFLIDKHGIPVKRYAPTKSPTSTSIKNDINKLI